MKKLISYAGKLGSGKNYSMMKVVDQLKDTGNTIYLVSFADPIKQILRDSFGLEKTGPLDTIKDLPAFTKKYVKDEIVQSLYTLLKDIDYEQFENGDDLYEFIELNYEKHEENFYSWMLQASANVEYDYSFRKLAQLLGTELARHVVDTIWVDIAFDRVQKAFESDIADYAFIPDLRFVNEYKMLLGFKQKTGYESEVFGITASDETRATRRGLSVEDLKKQDEHGSEKEVDSIIAQLAPEFIIIND